MLLIRALSRASADFRLAIVGDGRDKERCENAVERLQLQGRIQFVGWIREAEVRPYLERADLLVFTSLHETSGMSLIEAMSSGLPVIVLDCGGPSEVVGSTGIKVPVSSVAIAERELAAAIERFAGDPPEARSVLAKQSTERIKSFSWETQVQRVLDVYEMLYRVTNSRQCQPESSDLR